MTFADLIRATQGKCRVYLMDGRVLTADGQRRDFEEGCAGCLDQCAIKTDMGISGDRMKFQMQMHEKLRLAWSCPACGRETIEDDGITPASIPAAIAEIETDPFCFSCRMKL